MTVKAAKFWLRMFQSVLNFLEVVVYALGVSGEDPNQHYTNPQTLNPKTAGAANKRLEIV